MASATGTLIIGVDAARRSLLAVSHSFTSGHPTSTAPRGNQQSDKVLTSVAVLFDRLIKLEQHILHSQFAHNANAITLDTTDARRN